MTPTTATLTSIEPSPDHIIRDLHRIREAIVDAYGGDLHALTADLQRQAEESGQPIWRRPSPDKTGPTSCESSGATGTPASGPLQAAG